MIIGIHSRDNDLVVNPIKGKQLTNVRSSGTDEAVRLVPPIQMSLEYAVEFIEDDELVEITPKSIRLRKRLPERARAQEGTAAAIMRQDVYERAVERMFIAMEGSFAGAGYHFVMNQDIGRRDAMARELLAMYAKLDAFLVQHNPDGVWLFERFGYAECVYAPMLARFQFLDYYEDFDLPDEPAYARVRRWRDACLAHPAAQQVTREEIVKVYYDYTRGCGNGSLPAGRSVSTFTFEPPWQGRPMPPRDKWNVHASDADLGLAGA
jgi:glutathione S-transferase